MERDCESKLSKLNIEQNACIYHFGASVIHGQRSNILRLRFLYKLPFLLRNWLSTVFFRGMSPTYPNRHQISMI